MKRQRLRYFASVAFVLLVLLGSGAAQAAPSPTPGAAGHQITYDHYSLSIDGKRTFVWSGKFQPFRLPSQRRRTSG